MSPIRPRLRVGSCLLGLQNESAQFPCTITQQVFQVAHKLVNKSEINEIVIS